MSFKIYGVYRNLDMTEGRGPMVLEKLYLSEDLAWMYADTQKGIFGRVPPEGTWKGSAYGDWDVRPLTVH